jgi:hypothetical protein
MQDFKKASEVRTHNQVISNQANVWIPFFYKYCHSIMMLLGVWGPKHLYKRDREQYRILCYSLGTCVEQRHLEKTERTKNYCHDRPVIPAAVP